MNETSITVIAPSSLSEAKELAAVLAGARTIPESLQKSPADCLAIIMAGAELGLAPMQSIRGIVLIKGRPTLSADAMGALVKSKRDLCEYLIVKESTPSKAVYETKRKGDPVPTTMAFSIEDAKAAGLTGNDNWRKFPAAMLRARALSAICRAVYPDLLLGVYDPDELADVAPAQAARPVIDTVATTVPPSPPRRKLESDPVTAEVDALKAAIETAGSVDDLLALTARLKALPEADRKSLRPVYDARIKGFAQAAEVKS